MTTVFSAIFWGIVTFSILVVLHEGGHFLMARLFGVHVQEFMLGLPGPAIRFHGKETTYGITAVPLGGYVRISGMEPGPEDPRLASALAFVTTSGQATVPQLAEALSVDEADADSLLITLADWNAVELADRDSLLYRSRFAASDATDPSALLDRARSTTYRALPTWKRVVVLSAGVVINLVTAVLVFVLVLALYGVPTPSLTVNSTLASGGASAAGIVAGDTVVSIGGAKLKDWPALLDTLAKYKPGDTVKVVVVRDGAERAFNVKLGAGEQGRPLLGIESRQVNVRVPVVKAFGDAFTYVGLVFKAIAGFFNPKTFQSSISQSSGIIGVSVEVSRAARQGPIDYAFLVGLLSLSLGALNILPIPPLDGGKIAVELFERLRGKPLSRNLAIGLSAAGTALLFALIGYLMYADVVRYVVHGG